MPRTEPELVPIPLKVSFTSPADQSFIQEDRLSVSFTFNQSLDELSQVRLRMYPTPDVAGDLQLSPSGRTLTWADIDPSDQSRGQYVLLDSRSMPRPFVLAWRQPGDWAVRSVAIQVRSPDPAAIPADRAIVFAMGGNSGFTPTDMRTFVQSTPSSVRGTVLEPVSLIGLSTLDLVSDGTEHIAVAIVDTNDDQIYDPTEDIWAISRDELGGPLFIRDVTPGLILELGRGN